MTPPPPRTRPPPLPGRPPSLWRESLDEQEPPIDNPDVAGFGGWLIVLIIYRVCAPLAFAIAVVRQSLLYFNPRTWMLLTSPGSPRYHPLWSTVMIYEVAGGVVQFVASLALLWLLFARKKAFRTWAMAYYALDLVYALGDHFLAGMVSSAAYFGPETLGRMVGRVLYAVIWISYLASSNRVRNTFVK